MTLEHQVTNKEISQRIKELHVPQESLFYWHINEKNESAVVLGQGYENGKTLNFSAFTASELGELLPFGTRFNKGEKGWTANEPTSVNDKRWGFRAGKTLVDTMGKMLIYLLENKLITL